MAPVLTAEDVVRRIAAESPLSTSAAVWHSAGVDSRDRPAVWRTIPSRAPGQANAMLPEIGASAVTSRCTVFRRLLAGAVGCSAPMAFFRGVSFCYGRASARYAPAGKELRWKRIGLSHSVMA